MPQPHCLPWDAALLQEVARQDQILCQGAAGAGDALAALEPLQTAAVAVLEGCIACQDPRGLRLISVLARAWWMRGRAAAGRALAARLLAVLSPEAADPPEVQEALGELARAAGDYTAAGRHYAAALAAFQAGALDAARVEDALGIVRREQGALDAAAAHHAAALAAFQAGAQPGGAALAAHNLAVVAALRGDMAGAEAGHRAALAQRRVLGDTRGIASSLHSLGSILLLARRQPAAAQPLLAEALALRTALGDAWGAASSRTTLGWAALLQGAPADAEDELLAGLRGFWAVGDQLGVAEALEGLAAARQDGRLWATAGRLRAERGLPVPALRAALYRERLAPLDGAAPLPLEDVVAHLLGTECPGTG